MSAVIDTPKDGLSAVAELAALAGKPVYEFLEGASHALEARTRIDDWPRPQPLTAKIEPITYPVESLPIMVREAVLEVGAFVKAPIPMVAGCALSAISLAIQPFVDVRRASRLQGPCSLFSLTVADSGERKTTCDSFFTQAIKDFEREKAEAMKPAVTRYKAEFSAWTAERDGILSAIKTASIKGVVPDQLKSDLAELQSAMPEAPRVPRIILGDETPESLAHSLAKVWPSSGVLSSEAGVVLGGHAMGADSAMRNMALLNTLWDGGVHTVGRKTSESFSVRGARLTVGLQIQEATLRAFLEKQGDLARGTGLLARFLISWPESTQGTRKFTEPPEYWPKLARFHQRITSILKQEMAVGDDGSLSPTVIDFTQDAKAAWVIFHDEVEVELGKGRVLADVKDVASKVADNSARLACLFHGFENEIGTPVSLASFEAASQIVTWHLSESRRFFGELAIPVELNNVTKLDAWLIDYCNRNGVAKVNLRTIQQIAPRSIRKKAALMEAVTDLCALDRAATEDEGRQTFLLVNPDLLD